MKYEESNKLFQIMFKEQLTTVRPVDGEAVFNEIGFSHGFVHFAHPETGAKLGWSGVQWFEENAKEVKDEN